MRVHPLRSGCAEVRSLRPADMLASCPRCISRTAPLTPPCSMLSHQRKEGCRYDVVLTDQVPIFNLVIKWFR